MQQQISFKPTRSTDARKLAHAIIGTQSASGKVVQVVAIDQLATPPFDTTIIYEVDPALAGDLTMPQTVAAAVYVESARRIISAGGERTRHGAGPFQKREPADVIAEYNALIERANAE